MSAPQFRLNGEPRPLTTATLAALMEELAGDKPMGHVAVARNGELVPHSAWADTPLQPDDDVEVVRPFQGG